MDALQELEKELSDTLDRYDIGMADHMDVAIAMLNLCGLGNSELGDRARAVLMDYLERKTKTKVGKPKTAPTEKIIELRENGMTQEGIAQELGISLSTVRRELKSDKIKKKS